MKKIIMCFLFIFMFTSVSASFFLDYSYVNTDSGIDYLNIQYGNYGDNVNYKLKLVAQEYPSGYNYIPVIVSPKVYGVSSTGNLTYLYSVPTQTYYLSGANEYFYPNIFSLSDNYYGYVVTTQLQYNNYSTYSSSYVYPIGNYSSNFYPVDSPATDPEPITNCSSFFISGRQDVYIQEDEYDYYNFYIENDSSQRLNIISVTTDNPSKISIRNIDYPDYVSGNYVGTVSLRLKADSVSSDYDGTFKIYVTARYGNTNECSKIYTVNYYVKDEDYENTGECSNISFKNTSFTINDNSTVRKTITIKNNSREYDYEMDEIYVNDATNIYSSVIYNPVVVKKNSTKEIELEFTTDNLNYTTTRYLDLEVSGNLTRSGKNPKVCDKKEKLYITIKDTSTQAVSKNCKDIALYSTNILQKENITKNYSKSDGFFIVNNSSQSFNVSSVTINDNSNYTDVKNITVQKTLPTNAQNSINFDLQSKNVSKTQTAKANISVSGSFSDGTYCSSQDVGVQNFDITILDETDFLCSDIGVYDASVFSGTNNEIKIYNNTNKTFYVTDVIFQNRQGINTNLSSAQKTLFANSFSTISLGVTGNGSAEMRVSGNFSDGKKCAFNQTVFGLLKTDSDYSFSDSCSYDLVVPSSFTINNLEETFVLNFVNHSVKSGKILLSGDGVLISPNVILLDGKDNVTKTIHLSNYNYPTKIYYDVILNGCTSKRETTFLTNNYQVNKVSLTSYPNYLTPTTNSVNILTYVENSHSTAKEITLKLTGFFKTVEKKMTVSEHSKKDISLNIFFSEDVEKIKHNGYIELYSDGVFVSKSNITIDFTPKEEEVSFVVNVENKDKIYNLKINLKNNLSIVQNVKIDFGLNDSFVIEGEKEISLLPNEEIIKEYKIISSNLVKEDIFTNLKIINVDSQELLGEKEITLNKNYSTITGFFSFANMGYFALGILIIFVLFLIFRKH